MEETELMSEFKAQSIANTAWAFATLDYLDEGRFAALARAAELRISEFNVQNITNFAWAFLIGLYAISGFSGEASGGFLHNFVVFFRQFSVNLPGKISDKNIRKNKCNLQILIEHLKNDFISRPGVRYAWPFGREPARGVGKRGGAAYVQFQRAGAREHDLGVREARPFGREAVRQVYSLFDRLKLPSALTGNLPTNSLPSPRSQLALRYTT